MTPVPMTPMEMEWVLVPEAQVRVRMCEEEREGMRTELRADLIEVSPVLVRWLVGYRLGDSKYHLCKRRSVRGSGPW